MPGKDGKTSVFRTSSLDEGKTWRLAKEQSAGRRESLKALASLRATAVRATGLSVEADPAPHPLHANVCGWPAADEARRMLAIQLAEAADLRLAPPS